MTVPTQRQVLDLARAVIAPHKKALLLDADKRPQLDARGHPLFVSLQQAVASGDAFTVEPRQGVIALDVDTEDGALPSWLEPVKDFCQQLGCLLVEVTSGGASGGRHLWIVTPVAWSNEDFKKHLRQAVPELPSKQARQTQATRPPLSIHPSGAQPQLLSPATVPKALAVLTGRRPFQTEQVSGEVQRLLREGAATGKRRTSLLSIALSYVNAGHSEKTWTQAVLDPAHKAGQVVRDMPPRTQEKFLTTTWANACRKVRESPSIEGETTRRLLAAVRATAEHFPFSGKHITDQLVYRFLVSLTDLSGSVEVTCSTRMLAERTSRDRKAVQHALGRLRTQHQLLKLIESGRGQEASRWLLLSKDVATTPTAVPVGGTATSSGGPSIAFTSDGLHHAFGGLGLPAGAAMLWDRMDEEVDRYTVTELCELMPGPSRAVILNNLHALHAAGLAEPNKVRGHYWRKLPCDDLRLDRLAQGNGNAERAERRREQHQLERAVYEHRRTHRALKRPCSGSTKDGKPCRAWALPTGPDSTAEHCRNHASEDEHLANRAWRAAQADPARHALAA